MGDTFSGEVMSAVLVSMLDAAILSWIALRWYRRSVLRLMRAPTDAAPFEEAVSASSSQSLSTTPILVAADGSPRDGGGAGVLPRVPRRLLLAYLTGALAYSIVMTVAVNDLRRLVPGAVASYLWINLWPVVPVLALLLAAGWRRTLRIAILFLIGGSMFVGLVTLAGQIVRGALDTAPVTNIYWANLLLATTVYAPLALILLTGWHRIRGVYTMTLAATLCFGAGLLICRHLFLAMFRHDVLRGRLLELAAATTTDVAYYAIYMLLAVPVGLVVWQILRWLGSAYGRKAFSDLQLVADCWFALAAIDATITSLITPYGLGGIAVAILAFAAYRATVGIVLGRAPAAAATSERLLLLRVFGHQARTETLFDHFARHWRFRGPVLLIAGGDLAMRTVDPGDVLAFVSGRLRSQYVASTAEVPTRMERLDMQPDPDGRFRVNELYCLHDTWKGMLRALLGVSDRVVMDLRGFSRESRGCLYELQQIVAAIPSDRIVLIADRQTDRPLLESTLAQAWATAHPDGIAAPGRIDLVNVERGSRAELAAVMTRLLGKRGIEAGSETGVAVSGDSPGRR